MVSIGVSFGVRFETAWWASKWRNDNDRIMIDQKNMNDMRISMTYFIQI